VQSVTAAATAPDDQEGDADIPPRLRGRIDKETYLRLRDEHINTLRGIDLSTSKSFDPLWRTNALRQMEQQERMNAPELSGTTWTEIGPFNLPNGQTQQFPATTPVNGRVTAVVVDPTNSNTIYVGGGARRSVALNQRRHDLDCDIRHRAIVGHWRDGSSAVESFDSLRRHGGAE
jgi:hypothetical protein